MEHRVVLKELPEKIVFTRKILVHDYMKFDTELYCCGEECVSINKDIHPAMDLPPRKYRYCFVKYLDGKFSKTDMHLEFVEALTQWGNSSKNIRMEKLERVPLAACMYHQGSRENIGETFDKLFKWIEDNGFEVVGAPRQVFIWGPGNVKDPKLGMSEEDILDEIQIPIKCQKFFNLYQDPDLPLDDDPEAVKYEKPEYMILK